MIQVTQHHSVEVDLNQVPGSQSSDLCVPHKSWPLGPRCRERAQASVLGTSLNNALTCCVTLANNVSWGDASVSPCVHLKAWLWQWIPLGRVIQDSKANFSRTGTSLLCQTSCSQPGWVGSTFGSPALVQSRGPEMSRIYTAPRAWSRTSQQSSVSSGQTPL